MKLSEVTLHGRWVHLEPLALEQVDDLWQVALDPRVWAHVAATVQRPEDLETWIEDRLAPVRCGQALAFLQRQAGTGRAVGSTSLYNIDLEHATAEIGHTWLSPRVWGTPVNLEAKRLLLGLAFDRLGAQRVQLKADAHNRRSQRAIEKLGATREGVLRNIQRLPNGKPRDMVIFSILDDEWPRVRAVLDQRLAASVPGSVLDHAVEAQGEATTPMASSAGPRLR
ncbi:MAG: GNAT family protein [Candidatus Thermoplasmatota archaeon]|nr:GNAT family protein [Candidatus Thermoplasmatota archaeon]